MERVGIEGAGGAKDSEGPRDRDSYSVAKGSPHERIKAQFPCKPNLGLQSGAEIRTFFHKQPPGPLQHTRGTAYSNIRVRRSPFFKKSPTDF